jgi:Uma2 family endonuclease
MLTITKHKTQISPLDHGRKMSLKKFEFAELAEGHHYELSRGIITVGEVANFLHAYVILQIRNQLGAYVYLNPDRIFAVFYGMECKLLLPQWESERHPDIAVYLTKPKGKKDRTLWRRWIPEFIIEVVSLASSQRDYVEKREEYWSLGVKEYWIVDTKMQHVVVLRRGKSDWIEKRFGPDDTCETKLLPGFRLPCKPIFDAAAEWDEEV